MGDFSFSILSEFNPNEGLNLNFIRKMYLGWNKVGSNRPCEGWGLSGKGSFFIPSGIVFPLKP